VKFANTIAFVSFLVAAAALWVAIVALKTGANAQNQNAEIDNLVRATHRLQQGLDNQIVTNGVLSQSLRTQTTTNGVLSNSLEAQQREITATSHLDADIYKQLQISKQQLSILLDEKAFNAKSDSQSLVRGVSRLKSIFDFELTPFFNPPLDTIQNFGLLFDQKLVSFEAVAISLAANRLMMLRTHEYENLGLLMDLIDRTHIALTFYGHRYREVDSAIAKCFQSINLGVRYIEVYSPSTDEPFKDGYKMALYRLNFIPAKVFQEVRKK
jgi:hypothetical protein